MLLSFLYLSGTNSLPGEIIIWRTYNLESAVWLFYPKQLTFPDQHKNGVSNKIVNCCLSQMGYYHYLLTRPALANDINATSCNLNLSMTILNHH